MITVQKRTRRIGNGICFYGQASRQFCASYFILLQILRLTT